MIINTTDTSSLNALITLALKQTIQAAVQAAIEDKLADLDAATAGVAVRLTSNITALEKRLDTLSLINTAQEDALNARIQVLEDEVGRLQHANEARDKEREDIIADLIDTRLEYALEDLDLTEQVRNVLADATITI